MKDIDKIMFRLENRKKPLISSKAFAGRMLGWISVTLLLLILSLGVGVWGYRYFEQMSWTDAFLNAAMIFGGMGEIDVPTPREGKFSPRVTLFIRVFFW